MKIGFNKIQLKIQIIYLNVVHKSGLVLFLLLLLLGFLVFINVHGVALALFRGGSISHFDVFGILGLFLFLVLVLLLGRLFSRDFLRSATCRA